MGTMMRTRVALKSIANSEKVACMHSRPRPLRTASRPAPGRVALEWTGVRVTGPRAAPARARRPAAAAHAAARRARARRGARREPHHRDRRLRRAARRGLSRLAPRLGQLDAAARRPRASPAAPGRVRRGRHRPQLRRLRRARGRPARRARRRHGRAAAPPARPGLRRRRAARRCARRSPPTSPRAALPTEPEQVLVTAGALHAFTLLLRVLAGPGDRVLVEHPTYAGGARRRPRRRRPPGPVPMLARRLGPGHARGDAAPGRAARSRT